MSTKTIYGFDDLGNKVPIGSYEEAQKVTITLSSIPTMQPFLTGAGEYYVGDSCTITAPSVVDNNYFQDWRKDNVVGATVTYSHEYTFTVTGNATYYAFYGHSGGSTN